jgi:orotidine-5'-phosphate decarboxylase
MVYAHDSKSCAARLMGSSPISGTMILRNKLLEVAGSNRLIIALDGVTTEEAHVLAYELAPYVIGFKATDLIDRAGAQVLDSLPGIIKFLDPKINDIENTVRNRLFAYRTASIVTVHASMSDGALRAAATVQNGLGIAVVAVTVLTNIDDSECVALFGSTPPETIERFMLRAKSAGLSGVVCSPQEATLVRSLWPEALIITPGVRSAYAQNADQIRVATPGEAVQNGADFIVMGRQILNQPTPEDRLTEIQSITAEIAHKL